MFFTLAFKIGKLKQNHIAVFWMCVLTLMAAIRYNVGNDYFSYCELFYNCPTIDKIFASQKDVHIEWGAYLSMSLIKTLTGRVEFWFMFTSAITFYAFQKTVKNIVHPKYLGLALLIYYAFPFVQYHFNAIRHGVMTAFVWLAFSYIHQKNLKLFIFNILIGASFHQLAFFFLPFYWILNRNFPARYTFPILGFLLVLGTVLQQYVFNNPLLQMFVASKIDYYTEVYYQGKEMNNTLSVGTIVYSLLFVWSSLVAPKFFENARYIRNALFFSLCSLYLFKGTGVFAERIGGLLNLSVIFVIITLYDGYKRWRKLLLIVVFAYCLMILNKNLNIEGFDGKKYEFIPYKSVFFNINTH